MLSDQTKLVLNKISIVGMVLSFLLALLLPQPYVNGKVVVFMEDGKLNVTAIILFEFLMFTIGLLSYTVFYFTRIITLDRVKDIIIQWTRENNLSTIHSVLTPLPEIIVEAKNLGDKERIKKQREQIEMLKNLWNQEKQLTKDQDEEINQLEKELEELKIKEIKDEQAKYQNIKDALDENEIISQEYDDIFG